MSFWKAEQDTMFFLSLPLASGILEQSPLRRCSNEERTVFMESKAVNGASGKAWASGNELSGSLHTSMKIIKSLHLPSFTNSSLYALEPSKEVGSNCFIRHTRQETLVLTISETNVGFGGCASQQKQ